MKTNQVGTVGNLFSLSHGTILRISFGWSRKQGGGDAGRWARWKQGRAQAAATREAAKRKREASESEQGQGKRARPIPVTRHEVELPPGYVPEALDPALYGPPPLTSLLLDPLFPLPNALECLLTPS